jgi:signal transduction histidine kinase
MTMPRGPTATVSNVERLTAWERLRGVNPFAWDALVAVGVFAFIVLSELWFFVPHDQRGVDAPMGWALIVLACAPLAWRRRTPITTLTLTAIAAAAYGAQGYTGDFIGLAFVVALYTAAAYRDRGSVIAAVLPIAIVATVAIYRSGPNPVERWADVAFNTALLVGVPIAFGRFEFNRRRRIERDRDRVTDDAVAEERARIAREMHDAVAHAISVMVVQAGAARVVIDRDPTEASAALERIEETGRMGLAEMRRLLGILETDDGAAALVPQPGLDRLDELLETMRGTGLRVEAMVLGTPRDLPPGVDLTVFRILQEALTNVLKHAGDAHARVTLKYEHDAIEVEVADDGRGPPAEGTPSPGHGLIGMRERVALFGGSLETGARPGGGFVVRARIPVTEAT